MGETGWIVIGGVVVIGALIFYISSKKTSVPPPPPPPPVASNANPYAGIEQQAIETGGEIIMNVMDAFL